MTVLVGGESRMSIVSSGAGGPKAGWTMPSGISSRSVAARSEDPLSSAESALSADEKRETALEYAARGRASCKR